MTPKLTRRWPQLFILLFASFHFTQASEVWVEPTKEQLAQYHAEMMNTLRGDVSISGNIQDTQGNDLHDVTLVTSVANESGGHSATSIVSSHFSIMVTNCFSVGLVFLKDGYLSGERMFSVFNDLSPEGHGKTGNTETGVVVRLRGELEDIAQARTFTGILTYDDRGTWRVLQCTENTDDAFFTINTLNDIANTQTVNTLYVTCATNSQGRIIFDQDGFPAAIQLIATGKNSGFVMYTPRSTSNDPLKDMFTAPDNGYNNSIKVDRSLEEQFIYLYSELNYGTGYYGKAHIGIPSIDKDDEHTTLEVYIDIHLQTNGTRNVDIERSYN